MSSQQQNVRFKFLITLVLSIFFLYLILEPLLKLIHRENIASGLVAPLALFLTMFVCRKAGASLEKEEAVTLLPLTQNAAPQNESWEIHSAPAPRWVVQLCMIGSLIILGTLTLLLIFTPVKAFSSEPFPVLVILCILLGAAYTYAKRDQPSLSVKATREHMVCTPWYGIQKMTSWTQVTSCLHIKAQGVWGQDMSRVQLIGESGRPLLTIELYLFEPEEQGRLLSYLDERFRPAANELSS